MSTVIVPKSDQLNADSLIAGPLTITIRDVQIRPGTEQPVSIFYDGDDNKPWKCCKSMARVMVSAWGPDAKQYVGRSVTLYRDASVKWGGMEVGGIRISHMSHIDTTMTMALTATKGSRKPFTVRPIQSAPQPRQQARATTPAPAPEKPATDAPETDAGPSGDFADMLEQEIDAATDALVLHQSFNATMKSQAWTDLRSVDAGRAAELKSKATAKIAALKA